MNNGGEGWGCVIVALLLVAALVMGGVLWLDDIVAIQRDKAAAALRHAEAERDRAEAEREQAAALRDVTQSVRARSAAVDLLPYLPPAVLALVLAPFVWKVLDRLFPLGGRHGTTGR